jgi:hypothetical protein
MFSKTQLRHYTNEVHHNLFNTCEVGVIDQKSNFESRNHLVNYHTKSLQTQLRRKSHKIPHKTNHGDQASNRQQLNNQSQ